MATERRWTITVCGYGSVCEPVCGEPCPGTTEVEVMPVSVLREWIEDQRHDLDQTGGLPLKAARMILSRLTALLDDPERITDA